MSITAREVLDTSMAQLRTLMAFLDEQLDRSGDGSDSTLEARACREVLRSLRALIPKIDAEVQSPLTLQEAARSAPMFRLCNAKFTLKE